MTETISRTEWWDDQHAALQTITRTETGRIVTAPSTVVQADRDDGVSWALAVYELDVHGRGHGDVGAHALIALDGTALEGAPLETQIAGAPDAVVIAFAPDPDVDGPVANDDQFAAICQIIEFLEDPNVYGDLRWLERPRLPAAGAVEPSEDSGATGDDTGDGSQEPSTGPATDPATAPDDPEPAPPAVPGDPAVGDGVLSPAVPPAGEDPPPLEVPGE